MATMESLCEALINWKIAQHEAEDRRTKANNDYNKAICSQNELIKSLGSFVGRNASVFLVKAKDHHVIIRYADNGIPQIEIFDPDGKLRQ